MLIHIGEGCLVRESSIIGCFDMDGSEMSEDTVEFLRKAEKSKGGFRLCENNSISSNLTTRTKNS